MGFEWHKVNNDYIFEHYHFKAVLCIYTLFGYFIWLRKKDTISISQFSVHFWISYLLV